MDYSSMEYSFTNKWFEWNAKGMWDFLIPNVVNPTKILEIGSYEGQSACYLIDRLASQQALEMHCVDTWEGGIEHGDINMGDVESRFEANTAMARQKAANSVELIKHKGFSDKELARLYTEGHGSSFDFIYVDGSHQAPDVLLDAVLSFKLLKIGGMLVFDDYTWSATGRDPIRCPKMAIDAFTNIYFQKIKLVPGMITQIYVLKASQ